MSFYKAACKTTILNTLRVSLPPKVLTLIILDTTEMVQSILDIINSMIMNALNPLIKSNV